MAGTSIIAALGGGSLIAAVAVPDWALPVLLTAAITALTIAVRQVATLKQQVAVLSERVRQLENGQQRLLDILERMASKP